MTSFVYLLLLTVFAGAANRADAPWIGKFTAEHVIAASSPDNDFQVAKDFYSSAQRSIQIAVYQLDNPNLGEVLEEALDRGVKVTILLEGHPIPKIPEAELYIASRLTKKGAKVFFYDRVKDRSERTFKFVHAKYGIVDGQKAIVGSANYGNNGHPVETTFGNREWEVVLDDAQAAELFDQAFQHDIALNDEWVAYGSSDRYRLKDPSYEPDPANRRGKYSLNLKPAEDNDVQVYTLFAPENSVDANGPMLGSLSTAQSKVDVEQLNFETYWGDKPYNPDREESPMMKLVLKLAREGRSIRILLNNDFVFHEPEKPLFEQLTKVVIGGEAKAPRDNQATVNYLGKIAKREGLDLGVRLLNYRKCGLNVLHNKGMIVDGQYTTVSSLNWGESAMKFNREAGVVMKSPTIAKYYTRAFEYDWQCSN